MSAAWRRGQRHGRLRWQRWRGQLVKLAFVSNNASEFWKLAAAGIIASGTIAVTVVQKPFQFGYLASKWMHELATGGDAALRALPETRVIDTGVEVIQQSNVAEFQRKLAELKR